MSLTQQNNPADSLNRPKCPFKSPHHLPGPEATSHDGRSGGDDALSKGG